MSHDALTNAEQLYNKVKSLIQDKNPLDEHTARIIVESADDAIKEFGHTNQEKKIELRRIKSEAEEALPAATVEELRKRAEGMALKVVHTKSKSARNILYAVIILAIVISAFLGIKQALHPKSERAKAESSSSSTAEADQPTKFEVFFHERRLDLSQWQFVPDGKATEKLSAAVWTDKLKVRRLKDYATSLCIRHATTGAPTPEFSSDTQHPVSINETPELPQGGPRLRLRVFDVCLDVSREPVEQWFELHLTSKYWNSFNNPQSAWAAMPVVHPTRSAIFEIIFPSDKPVKTWERREGSRDTTTSELITDDAIQIENNRRILRWRIERPQLNWVYRFNWEW